MKLFFKQILKDEVGIHDKKKLKNKRHKEKTYILMDMHWSAAAYITRRPPVAQKFKKFITVGLRKAWHVNLTMSYHLNGLEKM